MNAASTHVQVLVVSMQNVVQLITMHFARARDIMLAIHKHVVCQLPQVKMEKRI